MLWWQESRGLVGHIDEALAHINDASDVPPSSSATRACGLYFHALNKLWTAHRQHSACPARADTPAFIALTRELAGEHEDLFRESELQRLVAFTPEVLDHEKLNTSGHRPGQPLDDRLRHDATERHRKLRHAHLRWVEGGADAISVLKKLAEFLYVIRSNIAHGEKTQYGPDLEKLRRDEDVSMAALPVLRSIVDRLLGSPSRRLVSYGTLKPGSQNSMVLADLAGQWRVCTIRGHLRDTDGLPGFRWDPHAAEIEAILLDAAGLRDRWMELDRFEGRRYRRRLVSLTVEGSVWIANCYESNA